MYRGAVSLFCPILEFQLAQPAKCAVIRQQNGFHSQRGLDQDIDYETYTPVISGFLMRV
jgi:hypothetical protein